MSEKSAKNRVVIAGGGFIGKGLARGLLSAGYAVSILTRRKDWEGVVGADNVLWDGRTGGDWQNAIEGAGALVNLTGRTVDCVKTPEHCDEILRSRVETTRALGRALHGACIPPKVWVQMSTSHYYGDPAPDIVCSEDSCSGCGFAPFVAKTWEEAHTQTCPIHVRSVMLRTSFVLGRSGGALARLAGLARAGLGGAVGKGTQGVSWIHEEDLWSLIVKSIETEDMSGVYLATAPNPVSNAEFMRSLRRTMGIPFGLPSAAWMVRIAAPLIMKTDPELALLGRYCVSERLFEEGFVFRFPRLEEALLDIFTPGVDGGSAHGEELN